MGASVRRARETDAPILEIVRRQALEFGLSDAYPRPAVAGIVASPERAIREWLADEDVRVWLIERPDTAVAVGAYDRASGEILGLYTAPDYQREGHATTILHHIIEDARAGDTARLTARVPHNAVPFFEDRGFAPVGVVAERGIEVHAMERQLR